MRQSGRTSSVTAIAMILVLGLLGGIIGGVYFFFLQSGDADEDVPLVPPSSGTAIVAANATGTLPDSAFPEIIIPAADVDVKIVTSYLRPEGWQISHLGDQVGHLEGTAWLDNPTGNVVLAGHVELSDGSKGAFADIDKMAVGDIVTLREDGVDYVYRVSEIKEVASDDLSVVYPTESARLTLITCSDYNFLSDVYENRIVVVAEKVS